LKQADLEQAAAALEALIDQAVAGEAFVISKMFYGE
jgi:hypothetical protein